MPKTILGLYLAERIVQAVALDHTPTGMFVRAAEEWESTVFNYAGDDTPGVDDFVERLSRFLADNQLHAVQTSATLDSSLLFLHTVPFLDSASRPEIDNQLQWELNEYFPGSSADAFITDFHVLARKPMQRNDTVLMVSVRRDVVQKIHKALARLKLSLAIVDVDHFSAETALRYNFPDTVNKTLALVGVKDDRVDVSILRNSEMESYRYSLSSAAETMRYWLQSIAEDARGLSSIALYGTHVTRELLAHVRESISIPIEAVNPFRSIDVASSVRLHNDLAANAFRYCAAVGVALRRD